jgi:hypothetical protein
MNEYTARCRVLRRLVKADNAKKEAAAQDKIARCLTPMSDGSRRMAAILFDEEPTGLPQERGPAAEPHIA